MNSGIPVERNRLDAGERDRKAHRLRDAVVVLGHIQRGGSPTAYDRVLATRYGLGAIDMVHRGEFGQMAALRGNKIISIPLAEAIASNRKVDQEILDARSAFSTSSTIRSRPGREMGQAGYCAV